MDYLANVEIVKEHIDRLLWDIVSGGAVQNAQLKIMPEVVIDDIVIHYPSARFPRLDRYYEEQIRHDIECVHKELLPLALNAAVQAMAGNMAVEQCATDLSGRASDVSDKIIAEGAEIQQQWKRETDEVIDSINFVTNVTCSDLSLVYEDDTINSSTEKLTPTVSYKITYTYANGDEKTYTYDGSSWDEEPDAITESIADQMKAWINLTYNYLSGTIYPYLEKIYNYISSSDSDALQSSIKSIIESLLSSWENDIKGYIDDWEEDICNNIDTYVDATELTDVTAEDIMKVFAI